MRKINFIVPQLYPKFVGGAEVFNYHLIKELTKSCIVSYVSYFDANISGATYRRVTPIGYLKRIHIIFQVINSAIRNEVLILSFSRSSWVSWIVYPTLKYLFNLKYVIVIHGGGMNNWKFKFPFLLLFKNAKRIIGVSNEICREYTNRSKCNIDFLPPLIPFSKSEKSIEQIRAYYGINNNSTVLLFVGSIKKIKNPEIIIDALKCIPISRIISNDIILVFAGDGPMLTELKKIIKSTDLEFRILFLGHICQESIKDLYKMANIYIISSDFEGTPIVLLEAMFNKLPIIASDVRGINNVIKNMDNGILFDKEDKFDLANKIQLILSDVIMANSLAIKANKYYNDHYNYQKMIDEYSEVFNKV